MAVQSGMMWLLAVSIIVNLLCVASLGAVWLWSARQASTAKNQIKQLEQKIGVATSGAIGMGHRIVSLEQKLQALHEKQDAVGTGEIFAYSQALQMFEQGADVATVASNCGFSSSEAQLMALVQKQLRKAPPVKPAPTKSPSITTPKGNKKAPAESSQ